MFEGLKHIGKVSSGIVVYAAVQSSGKAIVSCLTELSTKLAMLPADQRKEVLKDLKLELEEGHSARWQPQELNGEAQEVYASIIDFLETFSNRLES